MDENTQKRPPKDRAWFERKVSELGEALKQLPPDRQEAFERDELREDGPGLFMLDTHIFDKLAAEPLPVLQSLRRAVLKAGRLRLFITHDQQRELSRVPDPQRREELRSLMTTVGEKDGQLLNVAWHENCTLVTDDDRLTARAWLLGVNVWTYARFREQVL